MIQNAVPETLVEFINYSTDLLKKNNIEDARLNTEIMMCDVLRCDRMSLYLNFERPLTKDEIKIAEDFLNRRIKHEPLQYILGKSSFFGLEFIVNKNVLIPRPETELLVEKILADIKDSGQNKVSIFEIGSGTGCISIALAKDLEKKNINYEIFSIDTSKNAIEVAEQNRKLNNIDHKFLRFYYKDVFEIGKLNKQFDYIVSNPPYISFDEYSGLQPEVRDNEPDIALTDFDDGLKFFKRIFLIASDDKFTGSLYCEIGYGQRSSIENLLRKYNFTHYSFLKDYGNIDRILVVRK